MHFKNDNDIKTNAHHTATTSTSSTTSSTDSGVIIIDNRTTISKKNNNSSNNSNNNNGSNNINNISSTNNSNAAIANIKNTNVYGSSKNETTKDKIAASTRADNATQRIESHSRNNSSRLTNNNGNTDESNKQRNNNKINQYDECNPTAKNINIENIINIAKEQYDDNDDAAGKGNGNGDAATNAETAYRVHDCKVGVTASLSSSSRANFGTGVGSKNCSPTMSIRSTSISIVSIDENAIDSSIVDSDSEREADAEGVHTNYIVKKLGQQTTYAPDSPDLPNINKGLTVISQKISPNGLLADNVLNGGFGAPGIPSKANGVAVTPTTPQIGSIALTNSTDVTFGDKHFYEGPVTIQQILIDHRDKWKNGEDHGHDNPMFAKESDHANSGSKANSSPSQPVSPYSFILKRKRLIFTVTIIVIAIVIGIIFLTTSFRKSKPQFGDGDDSRKNIPINSTIDKHNDDTDADYDGTLSVMSRNDWMARAPKGELDKLKLPVHRVIISHTATDTCTDKKTCIERVRIIQDFHMDSMGWDDIGYNFLIAGDGSVYSARSWNNQGAHTKGYNRDSIGISFVGTFTTIEPTKRQLITAKLLIEEGVRQMKVAPDFCLYGARQLGATESPGLALYNIIKTWPHWSENINYKDNIGGGLVLRIIARDGWLAQPPLKPSIPLDLPVQGVIVFETQTDICETQAACTFRVRFIQTYNIESLQHDDIIYNFLIGGDGNVYEGRGWENRGAHMKGHNNDTISFAYIGTFRQQSPNAKQMAVTDLLLQEGVRLGKLSSNYKIYAANKFDPTGSATASATALYESFKDWPHWSA